jgi:uncharacterized protein YndB with AHSA1/START domain
VYAISHFLSIAASDKAVYEAITTPEGLASWWTEDLDVPGRIGSVSTFRFRSGAYNQMRVLQLVPYRRVEWECVDGAEDWVGTRVIFRLDEQMRATRLHFVHSGWLSPTVYMASCNYQWGVHLTSLKRYCEQGRGSPDPGRRARP